MFEWSEEEGRAHHLTFFLPQKDSSKIKATWARCGRWPDIVLTAMSAGGGSLRINQKDGRSGMFKALGSVKKLLTSLASFRGYDCGFSTAWRLSTAWTVLWCSCWWRKYPWSCFSGRTTSRIQWHRQFQSASAEAAQKNEPRSLCSSCHGMIS